MATITGAQNGRPPLAATNECGNAYLDVNKITTPAVIAAGDVVVIATVPAGILLSDLEIRNTDLDSGATLTGTLGYRSTKLVPDQAPVLNFFSAGFTQLQAASAGYVAQVFEPIKFEEETQIVFIASGAGTTAGTIWAKTRGAVIGVS